MTRPVAAPMTLALLALQLTTLACRGPASRASTAAAELSVQRIWSDELQALDDLPQATWRVDGRLLLFDPRLPPEQRTLELLDPASGARAPALDAAAALASLTALDVKAPPGLEAPEAITPSGASALYLIDGDLFVLDLERSRFERLTSSDPAEKCASFSPDGTKVAFVRENDLYVVDLASRTETRLTQDGSDTVLNGTLSWVYWEEVFGRRDIATWWAPDSRSLAFLRTDEAPVGIAHFVDFKGVYPELHTQRYPKAGTPNPLVRVGVAHLADGGTTWVELTGEHEYVMRVAWLPDSTRLAIQTMTRDQRRLDLSFADARSGAASHVLAETDPAWVNVNDDLTFLRDGRHFLWVSERSGFAHLYLYAMDGQLVRQVTSGDWALCSDGGDVFWLRQAVQAVDEPGGWVYFSALEKSPLERHLYRARLDGSGFQRLTRRGGTHSVSFSPDGRWYLDAWSTLSHVPSLELYTAAGEEACVVAAPQAELQESLDLVYPELLMIPARDGFELPAWILKPRDFDPRRRYPVILYVYGGPSAPTVSAEWTEDLLFDQLLVRQGYVVARCDNRSSTGISKTLESTVLERSIGDVELNDYVDAVHWLKRQGWVDAGRVGVWGWSGGGSMTLLLLTRSQEFRAGIAVAAVTDWRLYDTKWAEFTMKLPEQNPEGYAETRLIARAKDLHGRLLLVHGTYDDNVHPQNAWGFVDDLVTCFGAIEFAWFKN